MNELKPQVSVRAAHEEDHPALLAIDHGYSTEYVWQMELEPGAPRTGARFRETRLPRAMQVKYPREKDRLPAQWAERTGMLLAEEQDRAVGYASLALGMAPGAAWLTDLVVAMPYRRKGVGSRLVMAAQTWAREHGCERLVLEMQSKNYPAIRMAQKLAFEFSGYNDRYYENQEIALFFAKRLV